MLFSDAQAMAVLCDNFNVVLASSCSASRFSSELQTANPHLLPGKGAVSSSMDLPASPLWLNTANRLIGDQMGWVDDGSRHPVHSAWQPRDLEIYQNSCIWVLSALARGGSHRRCRRPLIRHSERRAVNSGMCSAERRYRCCRGP